MLRVSGQNMDIGETLRAQVEARIAGALSKYFDGSYHGHVTIARDGSGFRTECVLHLDSGVTLDASGTAMDAYVSADQSADRIEKRLRRYNRRSKDYAAGGRGDGAAASAYAVIERPSPDLPEDGEFHPVVIAETTKPLHRMSVSEAVLELDLTGAPVVVFHHAGSGRVNVVYRRRDGAIGWVDPPGPS
ncbi:MAG TPA: ribosome-associated translation inhibitor RaiA [Beijerinckiaceae bacterium]|jgi:ribosomal subunit interface protein